MTSFTSCTGLQRSAGAKILDLLIELQQRLGVSYVLVSHDLAAVARTAHQILVLRRGTIVEHGPAAQILSAPKSPYTVQLLESVPGRRAALAAA